MEDGGVAGGLRWGYTLDSWQPKDHIQRHSAVLFSHIYVQFGGVQYATHICGFSKP